MPQTCFYLVLHTVPSYTFIITYVAKTEFYVMTSQFLYTNSGRKLSVFKLYIGLPSLKEGIQLISTSNLPAPPHEAASSTKLKLTLLRLLENLSIIYFPPYPMRLFNPLPSITVAYEGPTWYRSPQSHKHHSCHRVLQAHGAAKVGRQVTNDGGEHSDHADGHHKAGPAVPVISGRHKGEQKLPEDGQEVHDVVET